MNGTPENILKAMAEVEQQGGVVQVAVPYGKDMEFMLPKWKLEEAMATWEEIPEHDRRRRIESVRHAVRKRARKGKIPESKSALDKFYLDTLLLVSYELLYSDGEKYLRKPIPVAQVAEAYAKSARRQ